MAVADRIRKVLHEYGVHSSTIQPEFAADTVENSDTDVRRLGPLFPFPKLTPAFSGHCMFD